MGFEEAFVAYLVENEGRDQKKRCDFEFKRFKNDLNICRHHKRNRNSPDDNVSFEDEHDKKCYDLYSSDGRKEDNGTKPRPCNGRIVVAKKRQRFGSDKAF
ncbi:hypothetical protein QVD17_00737 [Tagetes erecta]|uniref:Uncharacterized protein n=1 Tax=Tagetes erecta TaxID=13708 RepID=A0AAD8LAS5_TARER|nr:hypothetical protein QVD17_00737 [Tagetes erecta]